MNQPRSRNKNYAAWRPFMDINLQVQSWRITNIKSFVPVNNEIKNQPLDKITRTRYKVARTERVRKKMMNGRAAVRCHVGEKNTSRLQTNSAQCKAPDARAWQKRERISHTSPSELVCMKFCIYICVHMCWGAGRQWQSQCLRLKRVRFAPRATEDECIYADKTKNTHLISQAFSLVLSSRVK